MQCLTLKENFIFTCQINIEFINSELSESIEATLLTTINALYIFKKTETNKNDEFLEDKLLLKCLHDDIYIEEFSNEKNEIKYTSINDSNLKFTIKIEHQSAKEFIKILALFEGWKLAVKIINDKEKEKNKDKNKNKNKEQNIEKEIGSNKKEQQKDLYPKSFFLFQIIDSFILNNYVFQIDYLIIQLFNDYPVFFKLFFNVITVFPKIEINLKIDEQSPDVFPKLFPIDVEYSLTHLSLKSVYLYDKFAKAILPLLISRSPFLQTLDLSQNFLTNNIFDILKEKIVFHVHLKNLNLSYNKLSSENLSKYIFQISKKYLRINLFDLRGNDIDNRFLNNFNPKTYEELRNTIQNRLSLNGSNNNFPKEVITFDLRETNINIEKTSFRLYLKKKKDLFNHVEIKNNFDDNYETKFFSGLDNINFIFDIYFFKKNFYRYNSCSRNKTRLNIDVKDYKLPKAITDKKIEKHNPYNNWFETCYYDKEEEPEEEKLANSEINNDKKLKKYKTKKKEEEKTKNKNDEGNPKKNKIGIKVMIKKDGEPSSKAGVNENDIIHPETPKVIIEENSDSSSNSNESENQKKKKEEKNSKEDSEEENKKLKEKTPKDEANIGTEKKPEEKEDNNNNLIQNKEETKNEDKIEEEKQDNNNINKIEEQPGKESLTQENNTNVEKNNINDIRNGTEIIENTDDESPKEEEEKKNQKPLKNNLIKRKKPDAFKPKTMKEISPNMNIRKEKPILKTRSTLVLKNVDYDKINKSKKYHELDLYRELFKFFFLCDYYFDPILNSFATKMPQNIPREKSYMNIKIEDKRYECLKNYISNYKSEKKYKYEEEQIYTSDLFIDDAKQMYYDYINFLRIRKAKKVRKITITQVLFSIFRNRAKNSVVFRDDKKFNPNGILEHMWFFYFYLYTPHDYKIKIPLTTLNKLISRIKLESLLCLKEKSHNALGTLSKITTGLNISIKTQVESVYNQLTEKATLILRGLEKVLNFSGYNKVDNVKGYLFETGNFLDIFLEKADGINLSNDLVILCKYIQYWRNNYIRNLMYNLFHEISKKEGATRGCDLTEEFSKANEDYKNVPVKNMGLTKDIHYPEFAQHPSIVDYLYFSEKNDLEFDKDLKNITRYIKADQTYFKRNLYDRINFLFCNTSRTRKNKKNTYSLHRGNTYLKVMRILFRYNNNLDYKKLESKIKKINQNYIDESSLNTYNLNSSLIQNCNIFNNMNFEKKKFSNQNIYNNDYIDITDSLSKIAIEESCLRVVDFPEEENLESEIAKRDKKKIRLLLHSNNYNDPETLLDLSNDKKITDEQINLFKETTKVFNSKCQEQLTNLDTMTNQLFITIVQNYIKYFLIIKAKYKNDRKLWEYQTLECFYQLYRFANVNNFSYKKEKNDIDYPFIFLTIMCFYFEFSVPMIKRVKSFAYYLFSNLNHRKNCKMIIKALNNPFRYDWIMSTVEIYRKIDNSPLSIKVLYPSSDGSFKEDFVINETSTASDLMKNILENSQVLRNSKEKDFYWIYFSKNDEPWKYQYINHEQILVQLIAEEEQNENGENDLLINVATDNNLNEEKSVSVSSKLNDSNILEKNEKTLENYCEQKTFKKMHFEVKRRIFTPNLLNGNIESYNYYERELLFNQIKYNFYFSEIVDYTWSGIGHKIAMACYFENLAEKKRQSNLQRANDLESRISSSRIVTKFNMNMNDIETLPLFDNNSKEESFVSEHNFTYNNNIKDKFSLGMNSLGSGKNAMTYKTYAHNLQKNSMGSNNMDIIREEDDDDNNINSLNKDSIDVKDENKIVSDDFEKEIILPKNLNVKDLPLKQIYNDMAMNMHNLSDPKKYFFELVKERPILMSNIFEVNNKQSTESFPEKFLICLNMDKVLFLHRSNYTKFFEFKYEEIIKCLILDNYILLLIINVYKDEIDQRTEIILKLESTENRFIMEDILSYCQLFLATKTKSKYVSINNNCVSFLNNYKIMFDRLLPFRTLYTYPDEKNKKEIEKMRELLHSNELYKKYKEEKAKKKEEEIKESKKGKLDIKSIQNIMRFNNFEESNSEESEESVKVVPLKINEVVNKNKENTEIKKEENNINNIQEKKENEEEKKEEIKEEIKEEEKEPEKTEEEKMKEIEMKKKKEENEQKRKEVDKILSKALLDFNFTEESENKESEEEY